jgi:GT2 family glycosyltransferase
VTISVIVPVYNNASALRCCLEAVCASRYPHYECIVVDDGSTDGSGDIARSFRVRVVEVSAGPRGPACARNRGVDAARGDILLFVDADVVLQPDTLSKVADTFSQRPDIDAVFGSYDDRPRDMGFLSQYKNLFHHFVHQQAREEAVTFWSGCGAIRRDVFRATGGFDEARHPRSSGEDIELGYRLRADGRKVLLNKQIQVQHLKRWTLREMLTSDIWERALPWTRLILEYKALPNDLNLHVSQRVCALLLCILLVYLSATLFFQTTALLNVALLLLLAGAFALTIGTWSGESPHFQAGRRARALTYILIGMIVGLSLCTARVWVAVLLAPLVCAMAVNHWLPRGGWPPERVVFGVVVLSFVAPAGLLLMSLSLRFALPLLFVVLLIALINHRMFAFFIQKRGVPFTLASIPFFLSYYLYGATAFVVGIALYVLKPLGAGHTPSGRPLSRTGPDPATTPGLADLTKRSSR